MDKGFKRLGTTGIYSLEYDFQKALQEKGHGFHGPLTATKLGGRFWRVEGCPLRYTDKYGITFVAKVGFVSNLASVPKILWWKYPPDGSYTPGTVIHDMLCEKQFIPHKRVHELYNEMLEDLPYTTKAEIRDHSFATKYFGPRWKKLQPVPKGWMISPNSDGSAPGLSGIIVPGV